MKEREYMSRAESRGTWRRQLWIASSLGVALVSVPILALGQETTATKTSVLVRVLSHDAKLIGSNVGGARVTIRDLTTGEVIAEGIHEGGTGDTELIVAQPRARGATAFDTPGAAGFLAVLDLSSPTRLHIEVEGPLGFPDQLQRASKTLLVFPGKDIVGEGVVLELNGFTINIGTQPSDLGNTALDVEADVRMLCGCPILPGGLWDADRLKVVARLWRGGEQVAETTLDFGGQASLFVGTLQAPAVGDFELEVAVLDPTRSNFGRALRRVSFGG